MTRRNEDSGLIDLDALMREAATSEGSAAPSGAALPAPAPTPAPEPVRAEARVDAPVSAPTPAPVPLAVPSTPASEPKDGRPTVRPPAAVERDKTRSSAPPPSYKSGEAVQIVSIAKAAPPSKPANDVVPAPAPSAKAVPPAPSTMPSKLEPDSLEAVTTEPRSSIEPKSASASASIPPVTERAAAAAAATPSRRGRQIAIGAALAVALLAGGAAFMRSRSTVAATTPITTAAPTGAPSTLEQAPAAAPAPTPTEEEANNAPSADELPSTASSVAGSATRPALGRVGAVLPKPGAKTAENAGPAVLTEADLAGSQSATGDLGDAMRGAVGARDQAGAEKKDDPATNPNARQVRPSPGAVVGALGSVLPTARACLGPDEPVRSGLIVFQNDGTVARVDIKGTKPEDECVRAALSKAKVAPFVEETFSTRVTVRP